MWTQTVDLEKWHWLDWVLGAARGMASLGDRVVMGGQCRQASPGVLCSIQRPPRIPSEEKKERKNLIYGFQQHGGASRRMMPLHQ